MWVFFSLFSVYASLKLCSRVYDIIFPGIKLITTELVLIPIWSVSTILNCLLIFPLVFSIKIPDVRERFMLDSEGRTMASKLVFTIWAVFGGFILHFLLSNYLTVLLRPSYEEPVETAADLLKRDITPIIIPGGEIYRQIFEASSDPDYQEIARRLVVAKDYDEYENMVSKVVSTGMFADIGTFPDPFWVPEEEYKNWYRSSQKIAGPFPYAAHLINKKWPLKKVP